MSPASSGEASDRDISGAPSSLRTPAASFVSAAKDCRTLSLRVHHADHASLSRAARSERVWRQACIISATIAACSSIAFNSGGSVLSPAATNGAGQQIIVIIIIAAETMKYLQCRGIVHLSTSSGLAPKPVYFGSAHDLTRSVIPMQCRGEES